MSMEYKKTLWKMLDSCRGAVDTNQALDIVATIATCAVLEPARFNKIKEMGATSIRSELHKIIDSQADKSLFDNAVELSLLQDKQLAELVYQLASISELSLISPILREVLVDSAGKFGGEFGSSRYIETLLPELIGEAKDKSLLDATCGLARMTSLVNAKAFYFQEMNLSTASLTLRLLTIEGKQVNLSIGNSLLELKQDLQEFDLVVMEPPIGLRLDTQLRKDVQNRPYICIHNKAIPTSAGDALWIQFALYHLNKTGKAYLVLPQGPLFRGGYDAEIRDYLLDNELVDKVIALPAGTLPHTGIPPVVLILDKAKEKGSPIRFVDLTNIGTTERASVTLNTQDLQRAVSLIIDTKETDIARNVTVREIRQNSGNNLNVSRYIQVEEEIVLPSIDEQMAALNAAKHHFEKTQKELFTLLNQ
ncbi:hypothetical protein TUM4637_40270 [Shewanella hafniensis]|nr:hypothetical protein TUM4637_40270 [Shewanella hafniensis]